jgi:hypothetical protein
LSIEKTPLFFVAENSGTRRRCRGRHFHAQILPKSASDEFVTQNDQYFVMAGLVPAIHVFAIARM